MRASLTLTIRFGVVLAFVVLMPVLAVPQINVWVDEKIFLTTTPAPKNSNDGRGSPSTTKKEVAIAANDVKKNQSTRDASPEVSREETTQAANAGPPEPVARLTPTDNEVDDRRFHELQGRLQRLGVQYLVLEKWPGEEAPYRFHCRMAVPGSSAYARPFEARDVDPLRAMQQVLSDVENWCASHSTTTSSKLR